MTILQFAEDLSDRRAADAVRSRLDWKYLLRLDLADPGFDASVLVEFRGRILATSAAVYDPEFHKHGPSAGFWRNFFLSHQYSDEDAFDKPISKGGCLEFVCEGIAEVATRAITDSKLKGKLPGVWNAEFPSGE